MEEISKLEKAVSSVNRKVKDLDEATTLNDLNFFIAKNTDIETPDKIKDIREQLEKAEVLEIEDGEVVSVDKQQFEEIAGLNQEQRPLMKEEFHVEDYEGFTKTELAQEYSDWLISDCNIKPVWIKPTTVYYRYNPETHTWKEIEEEKLWKKAKKDLQRRFSKHLKRELKNQIKNHHEYIEFEEMGLPENEILLKDGTILDIETKETRDADAADLALNSFNATYNPDAEQTELLEFIEKTLDTEDMVKTLQEFLGYTLTWPSDDYEKILLILGFTDTGKSTLVEVIEHMYGESTLTKLSFPQLGMDRSFHVPKLKDSVLNIDTDMDDQDIKRKSRIKKIVSKEEIMVERKGKQGFNITPKANFLVTSNNAPDDAGATDAFYNRFTTLTATDRVAEEDKDRDLAEKLKTEENMAWLLNWALEGLERLRDQNIFTLNPTEYETKKMWDKFGNSVQKFISQEITRDRENGYNYRTKDVFEAYELWCETELEEPLPRQRFIHQAASHPDMVKRKTMVKDGGTAQAFVDIRIENYDI